MFAKYDNYLTYASKYDDYWSDVGISDAINILEKFSKEDWSALFEAAKVRPPIWLRSCSETLAEVSDSAHAYELLLLLVQNEDPEVAFAAKDSIRTMKGAS